MEWKIKREKSMQTKGKSEKKTSTNPNDFLIFFVIICIAACCCCCCCCVKDNKAFDCYLYSLIVIVVIVVVVGICIRIENKGIWICSTNKHANL